MTLEILASLNFLLGAYDSWLTQRRIKSFGVNFELNRLVKRISTFLGPDLAAIIGVLGPSVGWTYIFCFFNLPVLLALLVGYNLKRFEMQLSSQVFEDNLKKIQKSIEEFRSRKSTTLLEGESTPLLDRESSHVDHK